jgi:hypothetical protein
MCAEVQSAEKLKPVPPCATLIAAAQANDIRLDQIEEPSHADRLDPGDSVSALITLFDKGRPRSQWLVYLEVVAANPAEQKQKAQPPMVLYSSFGGTQKWVSVPAFVIVRTLGPFVDSARRTNPARAPEKTARFALNKGFLSLGFHHAAAVFHRLEAGSIRGTWRVRHSPFPEAELAQGREMAARAKITPAQESGLLGAIPALLSYFEIVQHTPGLSDILYDLVDLPSAWSMIRSGGIKSVGIGFVKGSAPTSPELWGLTESARVYQLPVYLDLNNHRALNLTFVVTSPTPPLLSSAGVVGLLAEKPDDPQKYLTLRVLSARTARPRT